MNLPTKLIFRKFLLYAICSQHYYVNGTHQWLFHKTKKIFFFAST